MVRYLQPTTKIEIEAFVLDDHEEVMIRCAALQAAASIVGQIAVSLGGTGDIEDAVIARAMRFEKHLRGSREDDPEVRDDGLG